MTTPSTIHHVPSLDGLRGAAVVAVVLFHAGYLRGGYLGVDLFFVLSGFLITTLLLVEFGNRHTIGLGAFWLRRARRLLPAMVVVLVGVALVVALSPERAALTQVRTEGIATLLYVANWHAISDHASYWASYAAPSPLRHTWSLAIEEQFYLVWPIVVLAALSIRRANAATTARTRVLCISVVGAVMSTLFMWSHATGDDNSRLYFGTDARSASVFIGAALACALLGRTTLPSRVVRVASECGGVAGLLTLSILWLRLDGTSPLLFQGGLTLSALASVLVINAAMTPRSPVVARALSFTPLRWLGLISYGVYLWHWPIMTALTPQRVGVDGLPLLALQVALTLVIAYGSYRFVEMPIRRGELVTRRNVAWAVPVAIAVTVAALVVVTPTVTLDTHALAAQLGPVTSGPAATATSARPPRILLLGDSVGASLAEGVLPHQDRFGVEVHSLAEVGCGVNPPDPGAIRRPDGTEATDDPHCDAWPDRWQQEWSTFRPDVAVLVIGWPGQTERWLDGAWRQPCDPTFDKWYADSIQRALGVGAVNHTPMAVTTAPYYRSPRTPTGTDVRVDCLNRTYRAVADEAHAPVIDLAARVCPTATTCIDQIDGVPARPDGLHFEGAAAVVMGRWITEQAIVLRSCCG